MKTNINYRSADLGALNEESRSLEISFSSEKPVERSWGIETLRHTPESVDTEFLSSGQAPLLADHNPEDQIGVVETASIQEGRGIATIRFGKGVKAAEWMQDVRDGIRTNISVGYRIDEMEEQSKRDGLDSYLATRWTPLEISVVSIPADSSVGIGRSDTQEFNTNVIKREVEEINQQDKQEIKMTDKIELNETEIRRDAVKNEQTRTADILAIGRQHSVSADAEKAVRDGVATNAFRESVLNKMADKSAETQVDTTIGLTETESRSYSLMKAIRASSTNNWSGAEFELECSNAVAAKLGKEARGFYLPSNEIWSQRDITTTTGAGAVGTSQGSFIDALRAESVLGQMGATYLQGLQGNVNLPKLTGATDAAWVAEGGDPAESVAAVGSLALAPKTLAAYVDVSRRLMIQSDPSIEAMLRSDLLKNIATNLDMAAIQGAGGSAPTGITNTAGIGTAALDGSGNVTWATVVDLVASVGAANAAGGAMSFMCHPTTIGQMRQTAKGTGDSVMVMDGDTLLGFPVVASTLAPAGTIVFGNFNDLVIATWGSVDILVDPYSQSNTGATRLAVYAEADTGLRNAESFAKAV